jgi:hypothetical protein
MKQIFKEDNKINILLEEIRSKPGLFLGTPSIIRLEAYIHGFSHCLFCEREVNVEAQTTILPLPFWFFHEFVKNYYGAFESTLGWCNLILENNNSNDEKAFEHFFTLYDIFNNLSIIDSEIAEIYQSNIDFSNSNTMTHKICVNGKCTPFFPNAENVFIHELSNNTGYICVVELRDEYQIMMSIVSKKIYYIDLFKYMFGEKLYWKKTKFNNTLNKKYCFGP